MLTKRSRKLQSTQAVKISVQVKPEIRIWDNVKDVDTMLEYARAELEREFKDVGMAYDWQIVPVPMDKIEEERKKLNN